MRVVIKVSNKNKLVTINDLMDKVSSYIHNQDELDMIMKAYEYAN